MIYLGTCSWKYDSWEDLVYSNSKGNLLQEYASRFNTVEIDQWFWSLFGPDSIKLPSPTTAHGYARAVPEHFKFTIKVPNSLTLTHFYPKIVKKLTPNPYFLSTDLFRSFLESIKPLIAHTGMLIFQFEYLNKNKMPSVDTFLDAWEHFIKNIDSPIPIAVEVRNPNFLTPDYFRTLNDLHTHHCFLEGYFMPPVEKTLRAFSAYLDHSFIIRFHGPDRSDMEVATGKKWNKIVRPMDAELEKILKIIRDLHSKNCDIYLNVNNHYEGSAPLTIRKIESLLDRI